MKKTALVTGAASGLGYELALLLAKDNYDLVLVDINAEKLEEAKQTISKDFNVDVTPVVKDLGKANASQEIYDEVGHLPMEVLINNAGFGLFGKFYKTNWEIEDTMLHVHVMATTQLTKLFLKDMVKRGSGKIMNMSSMAAFQPGPLMSLYYATKGYVLSFSEAIANELKGTGVTVTAVCPGPTKTQFQQTVSEHAKSDNKISTNMASAKAVALYGYKAMHKGKTVAIPGAFNKFLSVLPRLLPRNTATAIVRKIQEKNREA